MGLHWLYCSFFLHPWPQVWDSKSTKRGVTECSPWPSPSVTKAEESVNILDTFCLQPKIWNDLSNKLSNLIQKGYLLEDRCQHSIGIFWFDNNWPFWKTWIEEDFEETLGFSPVPTSLEQKQRAWLQQRSSPHLQTLRTHIRDRKLEEHTCTFIDIDDSYLRSSRRNSLE